jgi:hypothetical protein
MMKWRMGVLVMITVLAASSLPAYQTEEWV